MKKLGYVIIILFSIIGLFETIYFGGNLLPQSNLEVILDLVIISFLFFGFYLKNSY